MYVWLYPMTMYTCMHVCSLFTKNKQNKNKNAKALTLHSVILLKNPIFDRYFSTEIMVKTTNHAHIRDQRVKIYKNPCFVFDFTSLEFLTFFSTAILTGSWWRRKLNLNRKQCHNSIFSNFQFQENRIKTVAVRVPVRKHASMAAVTSSNMLMSWITNAHN